MRIRAFSLLPDNPKVTCSGVFIAENAHRCGNPTLHLQGKRSTISRVPSAIGAGLLLALTAGLSGCDKPMTPEDVTYKNTGNLYIDRVQPILQTRCYRCHAGLNRESGLRVDSRAYMLKGGKHGTALVPGDPEKSLMIKLVRHEGPKDDPMPMPNRRGKLPEQEIRDLERWVKEGALE